MTRETRQLAPTTSPLEGEVGSRAVRASREGGTAHRKINYPPRHPSPSRVEGAGCGSVSTRWDRKFLLPLMVLLATAVASPVRPADPRFPDWPCAQIKVPELSVAAVWTGPPIDDVRGQWQSNAQVAELVPRLAARRTPLEEAEKRIAEFLGSPAERAQRGTLLFAGLFETLSHERSEVMDGIERFSRKQKGVVDKIRSKTAALHQLQDIHAEESKIDELANQLDWDIRVYEDEKKTVSYVCEVPQLIERRLFALSRMIQQALE